MAAVPAVTTTSPNTCVCRSSRPAARRCPAATGAARQAGRSSADEGATVVTPRASGAGIPGARGAGAWSQARDVRSSFRSVPPVGAPDPRPKLDFMREPVAPTAGRRPGTAQPLVLCSGLWRSSPARAQRRPAPARRCHLRPGATPGERGSQRAVAPPSPQAPGTVVALPGPASQQPPQPAVTRNRPRCAATSPGSARARR